MIELSAHLKASPDRARRKVRDDLEIVTAIMTYAIRKNLAGFHFSGMRIPRIIQSWQPNENLPDVETFATEVATFQEHLHERIASLAHNQTMVREMWKLNERTRQFRESELRRPEAAKDILNKTAELVNALFSRNTELCSTILLHCAERRHSLVVELVAPDKLVELPRHNVPLVTQPNRSTTQN
jgi:DNA-binding FadR family transcriptional regulator